MATDPFEAAVSHYIWDHKYRYRDTITGKPYDASIQDTWQRVATALSVAEKTEQSKWAQAFYHVLDNFCFIPGGRILAGSGTPHQVTLFNCFAMGLIEDSIDGIFSALREGALTMQQGGGIGYDFSTLRPYGQPAKRVGVQSSGPVSFMRIWDAMCATMISTGSRRGAMMATLRCDHPDIEQFIDVKKTANALRHFNLSVLVTDEFMQAVKEDKDWPLVFPLQQLNGEPPADQQIVQRQWTGCSAPVPCQVFRVLKAKTLWRKLMRASYDYAEPGVLFIDQINRYNNLYYCEQLSATNPCGEIPLPPYGACDLGSINLTRYVSAPFSKEADLDFDALAETAMIAVRLLDNVIDVSHYPLPQQKKQVERSRRIGLGITGLADTLLMLGLRYGAEASIQLTKKIMKTICHTAYRTSIELAKEKGAFPAFERDNYSASNFVKNLPDDIQRAINDHGIRNSHLIAVAPTGTISLLADNVSSGLEPVFDFQFQRRMLLPDGSTQQFELEDYAYRHWRRQHPDSKAPTYFVTALQLSPDDHLHMQASIQPYVDNAISKTINIPADYDFNEFESLYVKAYELGLKGCTTFRPNPIRGEILTQQKPQIPPDQCCRLGVD